MTRLREDDIDTVSEKLYEYNEHFRHILGKSLAEIAAYSLGKKPEEFEGKRNATIGVIPVSCGQGVIGGFAQTVQQIIGFLGFCSFVTTQSDVGGLVEAVQRGAQVVFLADDDHFVAIHLAGGKVVDNGEATGRGYAAALALMAGGLVGKKVLLIGAGPVGAGAAVFLTRQGAQVLVYDIDLEKSETLRQTIDGVTVVSDLSAALAECNLVVEATPAVDVIAGKYITVDSMVAAPGIPLGLDSECVEKLSGKLIHDVLEIGVATMLFTVLAD